MATPKSTKDFSVLGKNFQYFKIKKEGFEGYYKKEVNEQNVLIAEPEKALVDYLYFISLGRKRPLERLNIKALSAKKIDKHLRLFKRKGLRKIVQEYL